MTFHEEPDPRREHRARVDGSGQITQVGRDYHQTIYATSAPARAPIGLTDTVLRDVAGFTGREAELGRIVEASAGAGSIAIHTVDGMPGVGKTALVTRAAHLLAGQFPDGRIFIRLHGHTPGQRPANPADVLAEQLVQRGIPPELVPGGLDARAAMWRDQLNDKRVLLVLDDATGPTQVEPLLPAARDCFVLITSRRRLVALEGAVPLALDVLPPAQATELFIRLARRNPVGAEVEAAAEAVRLCGHLPLAIALLAGRLAHHPAWTIDRLTAEFADSQDRLAELRAGERAVAAAFDLSYRDLPVDQQRLFRRLGLHPGSDTDARAAAALDGIPLVAARHRMEMLYTDHLVDETAPGRYRLHDLLRTYARSRVAEDPAADRKEATARLLDHYAHAAEAAGRRLARHIRPGGPPSAPSGPDVPEQATVEGALACACRTPQPSRLRRPRRCRLRPPPGCSPCRRSGPLSAPGGALEEGGAAPGGIRVRTPMR
ncbi:NB-ARC domain-containing protein [Streptomyces sp. NPDC051219]|uniref:NB-ARC domain-containing protein n=1 Tax=Streptomyces sp. NPDC051219 TaxID=3155283 RepID=UPI003415B455